MLLPLGIFILTLSLIFNFIRGIVSPVSKLLMFSKLTNDLLLDLIALGLIIIFCFFVGLFVRTQAGKRLFIWWEKDYLEKLPMYGTIKEIVQQFTGKKKMPFARVVTADVFGNGTRMIGFIADEHKDGRLTLFVPTGPNPTNGFIFIVNADQVTHTDIKPDEAIRTIVGVGVGAGKLF